jgi:hypothetical protein
MWRCVLRRPAVAAGAAKLEPGPRRCSRSTAAAGGKGTGICSQTPAGSPIGACCLRKSPTRPAIRGWSGDWTSPRPLPPGSRPLARRRLLSVGYCVVCFAVMKFTRYDRTNLDAEILFKYGRHSMCSTLKKEKKLHHSSHIRLIRRPICKTL